MAVTSCTRLLLLASTAAMAVAQPDSYEQAFSAWMGKFGKEYSSPEERESRLSAFKRNADFVIQRNAQTLLYKLELNEFADQNAQEFAIGRFGYKRPSVKHVWSGMPFLGTDSYSGASLPTAVDWTKDGAVTPPKNQGQCGSCWTFSATGALEGSWQIATGKLVSLSEQQLVDCAKNEGSAGCHGGSMDAAFEYLENHSVCSEESYPYEEHDATCRQSNCSVVIPAGKVVGYKDVPAQDIEALMEAVSKQPISVAIEADQMAFQLYQGGILSKECGSKLDHGVLLVGYGTENGTDYWKVKNSWGASWGEQGYVRLQRNVSKDGECGIKLGASYPVVSAADRYEKAFEHFVAKYGKVYKNAAERARRFVAFKKNLVYIEEQKATSKQYTLEVNEFADQSVEEFSQQRFGLKAPSAQKQWSGLPLLGTHQYSGEPLPASVDWAKHGAVSSPKNQGQCGSCWTFSATGALEGAWEIATGTLVSLSEQQLVDCAKNEGSAGCHGGSMDAAFEYLQSHSACTEASYAYEAKDGTCRERNCSVAIPKGKIVGYKDVPVRDMQALMEAVSKQPVSVAIEADQMAFQLYRGGILSKECGSKLDHGVLLVGYGTENGTDYWKVKNSWGAGWGEQGYVRLQRNISRDGECGIKLGATYPIVSTADDELEFERFVAKYGKVYKDSIERAMRFAVFKKNLAYINEQNAKSKQYKLEINEFADQSPNEFSKQRFGLKAPPADRLWSGLPLLGTHRYSGEPLPASVDWTQQGASTSPKNQGQCGSCWTFSATGALEGAWKIATGTLVSLSEQQLVDCAKIGGSDGCHGGSMDAAFEYLQKHNVCSEDSYPYEAKDATCRESNCSVAIAQGKVVGYKDVPSRDIEALMEAVSKQPVSVAIEADQMAFQLYRGGILSKECGSKLDHGVLLVGYGTENGTEYWKVKNSWGGSWGEGGYVRLQRNLTSDGECGIKLMASYPIIEASEAQTIVV